MSKRMKHSNKAVEQLEDGVTVIEEKKENLAKASVKGDFIYQHVTDRMLQLLDEGVVPWKQPWKQQQNVVTGQEYRGINQMMLGYSGRKSPYWLTYRQMDEMGGHLKEGDDRSTMVTFWKFFDHRDKSESAGAADVGSTGEQRSRPPLLLYYRVFNLDQIEFDADVVLPTGVRARIENHHNVQNDVQATGGGRALLESMSQRCANKPRFVMEDANRAYYSLTDDCINMPPPGAFVNAARYYGVLFHELGHWTGPRLGRKQEGYRPHNHGEIYSQEELVAEMTSAFACSKAGIFCENEAQNAAYISTWKNVLATDNKCVIRAAGQAQRAFDYLMGVNFDAGQNSSLVVASSEETSGNQMAVGS